MVSTELAGILRSLRIYHGHADRATAMDQLYSDYVSPGDLAFDIGSHVGDRVSSFRRLGARVVALEPQPLAYRALEIIHGRDPNVTLLNQACSSVPGTLALKINSANPTVSTASSDFTKAADGAVGWEGQHWDRELTVKCTTLDELIAAHGEPAFIKVDVEGFEANVLAGLSTPVRALSFEFTTIQKPVAYECFDRVESLANYCFNVALGESQSLHYLEPVDRTTIQSYIAELPPEANSGDIYAIRV